MTESYSCQCDQAIPHLGGAAYEVCCLALASVQLDDPRLTKPLEKGGQGFAEKKPSIAVSANAVNALVAFFCKPR